jgi:hypothetical protein
VLGVKLPAVAQTKTLAVISGNSTTPGGVNNSFNVDTTSGGNLRAFVYDVASGNFRIATFTGLATTYAGKAVQLAFVRSGATFKGYVNGVDTAFTETSAGTAPAWSVSITSTFLCLGYSSSSDVCTATFFSLSLYNLALSQADVTEIYELGGAVPERFKFGSQVDSSSATSWASALLAYDTFTGVSASGFTATAAAGTKIAQKLTGRALTSGRQWLATFTATLTSGAVPQIIFYDDAALSNEGSTPTTIAAGANSMTVTLTRTATTPSITFRTIGASSYAIASFVLKQLGAVCHFDGDSDGAGFQWHDESTNKLDATLTTTGVSWTKPQTLGYVRGTLTWAGTHEAKSLLGQRCLPPNAIIEDCTVKLSASSGGFRLVDQPDAVSFITGTVLTTARRRFNGPSFNGQSPGGTSDNQSNLCVDPDSVNFTGTIETVVNYSVTVPL